MKEGAIQAAIIGGGNMGAAYAACFLKSGLIGKADLTIIEKLGARRETLAAQLGCRIESGPGALPAHVQMLWLAVKPQDIKSACEELLPCISARYLVVSIAAGVPLARLEEYLGGHVRIARCMPNMPVAIGQGMTVYFPHPQLSDQERALVEKFLRCGGDCLRLDSEELIDAATALSGSGPGYVYYLLEHVLQAARVLGFTPVQAEQIVAQTIKGAMSQWQNSSEDAATLRDCVTSKGGTTAAALEVFDAAGLGEILQRGILRAFERAQEISRAGAPR